MSNNATATTAAAPATTTTAPAAGTVVHFRKYHPGGGKLGRCSYGLPGVPGIIVFDLGMFVGGVPPATLTISGVQFSAPAVRANAGVTSAVVAATNVAVAGQGQPIAPPSAVAATAANVGGKLVAGKAGKAGK